MMTQQSAILLQVYILPDKISSLEKLLNTGGNPSRSGSFFPVEKITSVHFMRWVIAPATKKFRASLIYSGNVDGTVENHFKDLAEILPDALDAIFEHCEGYPEVSKRTTDSRIAFMQSISKKTPAFYVGAPNRTVEQIRDEKKMQLALQEFVRENRSSWKSTKEAYSAIKTFGKEHKETKWKAAGGKFAKKRPLLMILFILVLVILLPFLILAILGIHFFYELWEKPLGTTINEISEEKLKSLRAQEDIIYQNQLSQVFETKGGLRKLMLKFLLAGTNFAAKNWFVEGQLMGTPTIHFARWVFIDGGKRFVFFSNFDGSFDGYLGDFVDNNGWGLNAIYGAAKLYPKTFFMFGGGSYKIQQFMGWGRYTQVPSQMWYSAYPWCSLQQIIKRSELSYSLLNDTTPSEEEMKQTLRKI